MNDENLLKEIQDEYKNPKKKKVETRKKKVKKPSLKERVKKWLIIALITFIGVAYGAEKYHDWRAGHQWQFPLVWIGLVRDIEQEVLSPIAEPTEEVMVEETKKEAWVGKVSYYSSGDGCIGCSENEIMANGQKFDENAMTLAFNYLPLNTEVRVTNLDNGANTIATVTDTGGFEAYGRIADLSKGLMVELNAFTDVSSIKIEVL